MAGERITVCGDALWAWDRHLVKKARDVFGREKIKRVLEEVFGVPALFRMTCHQRLQFRVAIFMLLTDRGIDPQDGYK